MELTIIGAVLIFVSIFCFWKQKRTQAHLTSFMLAREATIKDLKAEFAEVSEGIGQGYYRQIIALHGKVESPSPLRSELTKTPCVKFRTVISREWEQKYQDRDQNGRVITKTRTGHDTVVNLERDQPFFINDGTGSIRVSPEKAGIDLEKVTERYESADQAPAKGTLSVDGQVINLLHNLSSSRRILGYRYQEWLLPLDRRVFIHGEVTDSGGELSFQKPFDPEKKEPYVVTLKSRSELIGKTAQTAKIFKICAIVSLMLGLGLTAVGIFTWLPQFDSGVVQ